MGVLDEFKKAYGDDLGRPPAVEARRHNWVQLCTCGHLARHHSPTVGGTYRLPPPTTQPVRGQTITVIHLFVGCCGSMPNRDFETETLTRKDDTVEYVHNPTCPCTEFRPIADLDRPNRYFCQRVNPDRHPFSVGVRAFATHISRRKAAQEDPDWATEEFDRRFVWIEEKRRCSISNCKATGEGVLPVFVNEELLSELRCEKHT